MKNRIGMFCLPMNLLREHPEVVADLTECMAIVRAEVLFQGDRIQYFALSPLFDEISSHMMAPEYEITCDLSGEVIANKLI